MLVLDLFQRLLCTLIKFHLHHKYEARRRGMGILAHTG